MLDKEKWEESRAEAKDLAQDYLDKKETRASCIKYFESHFKISTATANRWYNRIYDELRIPDIQEALDLKSFKDTLETELQNVLILSQVLIMLMKKVELISKITKQKGVKKL